MGGRTAMTLACRYPDRVDGFISLDAAPVDEQLERRLLQAPAAPCAREV